MAFPPGRAGFSWIAILLLTGLSVLSWASTYTGLMELITASSGGDIAVNVRVAVAFAVVMLQLMIIYVLDALFSRALRWWLRPFYALGYAALVLIGVGFAFGFYWKHLEAGSAATSTAETHLRGARQAMELGAVRLKQLQETFAALASLSAEKAAREHSAGGTCGSGGPGDGPRRRLRDGDAQGFQIASHFLRQRAGEVKAGMAALGSELRTLLSKAPATTAATGTRGTAVAGINDKLDAIATRFNALRTDPQLLQLRDAFKRRAGQTTFADGRGATFACPDPQLQAALGGAVRAIGELPELHSPRLSSYEGPEAVIEAFRRLIASGLGAWHRLMAGTQDILAQAGFMPEPGPVPAVAGGLGERDYLSLLLAAFVDFSILLVSVNRPVSRVYHMLAGTDRARNCRLIEFLLPIYRVFAGKFDPAFQPGASEVISPLVDVVFDHKGKYYAAAPLDYGARRDPSWIQAAANRARQRGEMFVYAPTPERAAERSRYISSALVVLQGQYLVRLVANRRGLSDETVRRKLERQGSLYAQADSFRVYAFAPGAWEEFLHGTIGSGAKAGEHHAGGTGRGAPAHAVAAEAEVEVLEPVQPPWARRFPETWEEEAVPFRRSSGVRPFPAIEAAFHEGPVLLLSGQTEDVCDEGSDFDPGEDLCCDLKFNCGHGSTA